MTSGNKTNNVLAVKIIYNFLHFTYCQIGSDGHSVIYNLGIQTLIGNQMNVQEMAINKRTALMMFWNAGYDTEEKLLQANAKLETLIQPSNGYYYASEVSELI